MSARRRRAAASDDQSGVRLYRPTPKVPQWRLVYVDPHDDRRTMRRITDEAAARTAFDEARILVTAAGVAGPKSADTTSRPTVDALAERLWVRLRHDGCSNGYVEGRRGVYRTWIGPVCGHLEVTRWASTSDSCRLVLGAAREAGRAPATVQSIGSVLRSLVSEAHDVGWLVPTRNPMLGRSRVHSTRVHRGWL